MSYQHHRFHSALNSVCYPSRVRSYEHGAPCIFTQADELGGVFTRITRGLPFRSVANFSPCIFEHKGHTLVAWRSQPEPFVFRHDMKYFYYNSTPTDVYVGELLSDDLVVGAKKIRDKPHVLSYEDPRLFVDGEDNLMCQFITSTYASRFDDTKHKMAKTPKVCVGELNRFGQCVEAFYPEIGSNHIDGGVEKNWCFFNDEGVTRLLYSTMPIVIKTPGEKQKQIDATPLKSVTGDFPTFNSTAPVKIGDEWLVFYHFKFMGRIPTQERPILFYATCAYTLDEKLTRIVRRTPEPVFQGSLEDGLVTWTDVYGNPVSNQPACVLPFGCVVEDNTIAVSLGVNDSFMGIFRMGLNDLLSLMDKV